MGKQIDNEEKNKKKLIKWLAKQNVKFNVHTSQRHNDTRAVCKRTQTDK
jgi:hypothetical protein